MSERSSLWLGVEAGLAMAWFAFMFFALIPGSILWLGGSDFAPGLGLRAGLGGFLMAAAGLALLPPTIRFVRQGRGTQAPFDPPTVFVSEGLYRWMRNPMYVLYMIIIGGEALFFDLLGLYLYTTAFVAVAHAYVTVVEEKELMRRFGQSYEDYCDRVPRWIPRRPGG